MKEKVQEDTDDKQLLITIDEAARRLSIGRSHIYAQMQHGNLRSVRIGRSRRILEEDLDDFIEQLLGGSNRIALRPVQLAREAPVKRLHSRSRRR